jgi:hypothetical protein
MAPLRMSGLGLCLLMLRLGFHLPLTFHSEFRSLVERSR